MNNEIKKIYNDGIQLKEDILKFLSNWPVDEKNHHISWEKTSDEHKDKSNHLSISTLQWFNTILNVIIPYTVYDNQYLYFISRRISASLKLKRKNKPYPTDTSRPIEIIERKHPSVVAHLRPMKTDIDTDMDEVLEIVEVGFEKALLIVQSVPSNISSMKMNVSQNSKKSVNPNTAFILMAMNPDNPELVDINNMIKDVCSTFNISAQRADDIEHQDKITDVILKNIESSEFLIADLSGERPNVYYEVGFAHACGKRPILFRKAGTKLHFDLSVHNVPEYKNLTELKKLLSKRFEHILGRKI